MELALESLALLFLAAALAGFMDTLAGGGGLITMPALVLSGIPLQVALGTNKLQACLGTATSSLLFLKRSQLNWPELRPLMGTAFIGALAGTLLLLAIDSALLGFMIPCVLLVIAGYFFLAPYLKLATGKARMSAKTYTRTLVPLIGAYDGFLGPGTGSFFTLAGVSLRGLELIAATAMAKPLNFASNLASLIIFLIAGKILWLPGIIMVIGQMLGAWLGAHYLFNINPAKLRLLIVGICLLMLSRYLWQQFH
jgi:uncharacterized protein